MKVTTDTAAVALQWHTSDPAALSVGEFPTTSSSSFEFEFELARSFSILCGWKPSSCI